MHLCCCCEATLDTRAASAQDQRGISTDSTCEATAPQAKRQHCSIQDRLTGERDAHTIASLSVAHDTRGLGPRQSPPAHPQEPGAGTRRKIRTSAAKRAQFFIDHRPRHRTAAHPGVLPTGPFCLARYGLRQGQGRGARGEGPGGPGFAGRWSLVFYRLTYSL
jgi:hypothetical protein